MEDGGYSLFDFCVKIHQFIQIGKLEISEWHRIAKIIFKQMVECVEYIHNKNVAHFDISLENFVINDIDIILSTKANDKTESKIKFDDKNGEGIQVKLCDFGLAEIFPNSSPSGPNFKSSKFCGKRNYKSPEISKQKEGFNAKSNDIWCLGVCLFMLMVGSSPWIATEKNDKCFNHIMNGNLLFLLSSWNKLKNVNKDLVNLFNLFFKMEQQRITMKKLKKCKWLN